MVQYHLTVDIIFKMSVDQSLRFTNSNIENNYKNMCTLINKKECKTLLTQLILSEGMHITLKTPPTPISINQFANLTLSRCLILYRQYKCQILKASFYYINDIPISIKCTHLV